MIAVSIILSMCGVVGLVYLFGKYLDYRIQVKEIERRSRREDK